jgi:ABC-type lipoprotein release transport system permease subunit
MTINIFEQKKEIAILRSLGMNQRQIIYIYICEAIILIFSSSIIGIIIGSFISYTMSLQWQMFTYINISYNLKLESLIMIILFSILGGILSTIVPAKNMLKIPISQLIKEI